MKAGILLLRVSSEAKSRMMKNPMKGMTNGRTRLPVESAMSPISRKPQPPIGVIISNEEALFVRLPSPRSESEKIVGNMMASKR